MRVRATRPISSSLGHEWKKAGQILEIPDEDAAELMSVPGNPFEIVDSKEPVTEPEPDDEDSDESKKPPARGRRTRVTED